MHLPVRLTRKIGREVLRAKKNSPHIFFGLGILGSVASTVMACRATLKLPDTLNQIQYDLARAKELKGNLENQNTLDLDIGYSDGDYYKDMAHIYGMAGFSLVKLYAPSILVGSASISMLTGSHVQMTRRNSALMAAYAAVQKAYEDYRDRVREAIGEDYELDFYRGVKEEVEVDGEKKKIVTQSGGSPYRRCFDEYCPEWRKDPELNLMFVRCQMNFANNILHRRGHIFLNEVYDSLGLDRSPEGAMVGWLANGDGDNYVDFGIYQAGKEAFVEGWERSVWLDFNVDGVIYDKI